MDYSDAIINITAEHFGVKTESISAKTRIKQIVIARQSAIVMMNEFTEMSLKSIGYCVGGRDHATVIHSVRTIEDYEYLDSNFRIKLNNLRDKIRELVGLPVKAQIQDEHFEALLP